MYKYLAIPIITLVVGSSQREIKLDLYLGEEKVGSASFVERVQHGHRTRETRFYTRDDAQTQVRIINTKTIDSNAFPISEEEEYDRDRPGFHQSLIWKVRYDKNGNAVLSEYKDKRLLTTTTIAPTPGYSRADASDLWFSRVTPSPGTTVTSTVFDIEHAKWLVVETTYLGRKWITVSGRQIEANEVRDIRDGNVKKIYLDDKGQPVLMRNGQIRTEKHF